VFVVTLVKVFLAGQVIWWFERKKVDLEGIEPRNKVFS